MKIYENLTEIADRFDVFLVDAYGVFWDGSRLIPGAAETLAAQVALGKPVCILSNTSMIQCSYHKEGLTKGIHYTDVITSGDIFYDTLKRDALPFPGHKIYISGITESDICADTNFQIVPTLAEADLVYFGIPQLTEAEVNQYPDLKDYFFKSHKVYDTTTITPIIPKLKQVYDSGLPVVSTNPDLIVSQNGKWVIRQGTLAQLFRDMGGQIYEYGKPYPDIYRYAFQKLGINPSERIAMVGDTFRTDIKGALDAGITPVWCLDTGIARYEVEHGTPLLSQAGGSLEGITLIHHL